MATTGPKYNYSNVKRGTIDRTVDTSQAERLTPEQLAANKEAHKKSMKKAHDASAFGKAQVKKYIEATKASKARKASGITGTGGQNVNEVYRNIGN